MDHGRMQPWPPNQLESKHTRCHIFVFVSLLLANKSNSHSIISKPSLSPPKKTHSKLIIFFSHLYVLIYINIIYIYIYSIFFYKNLIPLLPPTPFQLGNPPRNSGTTARLPTIWPPWHTRWWQHCLSRSWVWGFEKAGPVGVERTSRGTVYSLLEKITAFANEKKGCMLGMKCKF